MTSREIRSSFLSFFEQRGHRVVPSAPVVPHGDPTLLFTNAGMNQFKDVFLGRGTRDYVRAVDTQKCIRVSGKHNDLEEVGYDTYHHTFFEMLGNWSFGDYYKEQAIAWSWELLTEVWGLDKERLYATVYRTDDESFNLWKNFLPEAHILRFDEKDNFWEMGETGPCGPCTEIHYDRTPDKSGRSMVNAGVQEVIEIWNNVFIQNNRRADGTLEELESRHVDTGMGFERACAVIQGKMSNYDTDVFLPVIQRLEEYSSRAYNASLTDPTGVAMRVIADHVRTLSFAIADGAVPGNEGRGYVLRRILRRASRYARNLSFTEPVIYQLVDVLVQSMGDVFPEIKEMQTTVERIIRAEEESFLQTLERGLDRVQVIVEKSLEQGSSTVSGEEAFQLYDTFGFPLDLTQLLTKERGLEVDVAGFDARMLQQKERSREARKAAGKDAEFMAGGGELATAGISSRFEGYQTLSSESDIVFVEGPAVALRSTPFYAESGGQQSDNGTLLIGGNTYNVIDVRRSGSAIIHVCDRDVEPLPGDLARAEVDVPRRWNIQRNHSVTHLLHEALRRVLGTHVKQSGSLVAPNHLRFDFSHFEKVSSEELRDIEAIVNEKILERVPVQVLELPIVEAQKVPNVKMFFGDKYGDFVRVVIMDERFSAEFCGGTHVTNTAEIGLFAITQESAVASGVRRIEAISGGGVADYIKRLRGDVEAGKGHAETLGDRVRQLEKELRSLQTQSLATAVPDMIAQSVEVSNVHVVVQRVEVENMDQLKELGDAVRSGLKHRGIGLLATVLDDKVQLVCVVTDDEVKNYPAGKLVGAVAALLGGGGGGKAHMATAGGKDVEKLEEVLKEFPLIVQGWSVS